MADEVTPFRRRGPKPLPPGEAALSRHSQRAQPGARALAAEQAATSRAGYMAAVTGQKNERLIATGKVVPARITIALDIRGLEGREVDVACGAAEPDVDMWELGLAAPTAEQVRLLAELTGFTVAFFYQPIAPGPMTSSPVFMCHGPRRRCEITAADVVDENGVLLYGGEPRPLPAAARRKVRARPPAGQGALF
jgi:hypothetical protein